MRPVHSPAIGEVFHEALVSEELDPPVLGKRERGLINPEARSPGAASEVSKHLRSCAIAAIGGVRFKYSEVDVSTAC